MAFRHLGVDDGLAGLHRQRAAVGHGVGSVDREVQQHLLELHRVDHHRRQRRRQRGADLDVVAQQATEHRPQVLDDAADVERPWLQHLAAAEREQLLRQRGRALAGLQDVAGIDAQRIGFVQPGDEQLRVAVDHRQQVVEVVRDAAGELADGFHLLRLDELLLELFLGS